MSRVIFLNGCGSSGKTSITLAIQTISDTLWIAFGVDTFANMLPFGKEEHYFKFVPDKNQYGKTVRVETTELGHNYFSICPDLAKLIADKSHNLIIDEVLLEDDLLKKYVNALTEHTVYYIGVFCDLKIMQEREALRKDRLIGLANDQIERVHNGLRANYDLSVDTSFLSPFEVAEEILDYIEKIPEPKSFRKIRTEG